VRIGFVLWDVSSISGGANAIIEHASELRRRGHEVVLLSLQAVPANHPTWHPALAELTLREINSTTSERFDFIFATWWTTYFELWRFESTTYGYFNQSLESRFYQERAPKLLNRLTYSLPLLFVTEARWLEQFIRWMQPTAKLLRVPNGLNDQFFSCVESPSKLGPRLRILLEGSRELSLKGIDEALELLQLAHKMVDFETGWLTANSLGFKPSVGSESVEVFERVPIDRVREVLRRFDVLLKLSSVEGVFGPPLEMFSQGGTAITSVVTGSDEFMIHGHNSLLVEAYNRAKIIVYLRRLAEDPSHLRQLRANALETAKAHPTWKNSAGRLASALEDLNSSGFTNANLRPALQALSELRMDYLDTVEEAAKAKAAIGDGERLLLNRYRALKGSEPLRLLRSWVPTRLRRSLRTYFERWLS